jgi:hypothetical protein
VIRQVTNSPIHQLHNSALRIIHRVMQVAPVALWESMRTESQRDFSTARALQN